jgi:acetyltransferase
LSIRNLDCLFKPQSVALIGATPRAGTVGDLILRNLRTAEFAGPLMLVNPTHGMIGGMPAYPDVKSLPNTPDLAIIATPPATVPALIAELGSRGTRAAVVITAGFGELGAEGKALQQSILAAAKPYLLRIVGPNCIGVMVPGAHLNASFAHLTPPEGGIAFVSQSGAIVTALLDWAAPRDIGFSHIVSLGDMADVDFGDMLDYLGDDPKTRAILLYVEAVTSARKFMSAARAAARRKPVLVVKVGRFAQSQKAAASHTGALAGSDKVYDAAFRRAGMLRVRNMAELFEAAETLATTEPQQGDRLAILTNGGGPAVLATDELIERGGVLASLSPATVARLNDCLPRTWSHSNPIDMVGDADAARYRATLEAVLDDRDIDAALVINCPTAMQPPLDLARAVIDVMAAHPLHFSGRNVFANWIGDHAAAPARKLFADAGIASYETPDAAIRGFMNRVDYRRNQELLLETVPAHAEGLAYDRRGAAALLKTALDAGREWLEPEEVASLFVAYAIPFVATRIARNPDAAAAIAAAIAKPVALKIHSPDITHKSDIGGVALNLTTPDEVRNAALKMLSRVTAAAPEARLDGFVVQEMVTRTGALELLAGVTDDVLFGPVILFGQGGIAVEILDDTTIEFPPLNQNLARAQIARTRVSRLMRGYRNQPATNTDAVADVLIRLSQLVADHAAVTEIDINPLLADGAGTIGLDGRVRIRRPVKSAAARLAIRPYPDDLVGGARMRDGTPVVMRPIRPEDETAIINLARRMTAEDLRMRFFVAMKELTHQFAAKLTQIDYDREMALIVETQRGDEIWGVARFFADPDNVRAEFAVAVRSDLKGRGLGYALMTRLIDVARSREISELFGDVLSENDVMLRMCRGLGFKIESHPVEPGIVRVILDLNVT